MSWILSRFRTGDLVEIRSPEEILATLDQHGCVDELPFMPEMLQFCGRQFRVSAIAHKTCDTARETWKGRRLNATVHLDGLRCDGSAHGGCQAECNLFWKDIWLKPAEHQSTRSLVPAGAPPDRSRSCTEELLAANTVRAGESSDGEPRYACQATKMYDATTPLAWWDARQYVFDVTTGNHSAAHVLRVVCLAWLRCLLPRMPIGYRFFTSLNERIHRLMSGRPVPSLQAAIERGRPTPVGKLDLRPGELVRIKSQSEIERTLNDRGNNRGLSFDPEEMAPYCGRAVTVHKSVTRIIHEPSGKMLEMKQPCIMLEGVVCKAEYADCRLNCPRAIPSYWRELWLERV